MVHTNSGKATARAEFSNSSIGRQSNTSAVNKEVNMTYTRQQYREGHKDEKNACENYIAQGNVCCGKYVSAPPHYCTESIKSTQVLLTIS